MINLVCRDYLTRTNSHVLAPCRWECASLSQNNFGSTYMNVLLNCALGIVQPNANEQKL